MISKSDKKTVVINEKGNTCQSVLGVLDRNEWAPKHPYPGDWRYVYVDNPDVENAKREKIKKILDEACKTKEDTKEEMTR
ncbi:MAG: hypothetical protein IKQ31_04225 [Clostridia bacterium]|nr:hypothetical protein [Clostridia bacterium]